MGLKKNERWVVKQGKNFYRHFGIIEDGFDGNVFSADFFASKKDAEYAIHGLEGAARPDLCVAIRVKIVPSVEVVDKVHQRSK